jgi:nucleoid-associated protein YgaU
MGIFNFIKDAGQKYVDIQKRNLEMVKDVFDGDDDEKHAEAAKKAEAANDSAATKAVHEQMAKIEAMRKAAVIREEAKRQGLGGDYRVMVEGETVTLAGTVPDQSTLEKVVLTAGNIEGISSVDAAAMNAEVTGNEAVFYTVQSGDSLSKIAKVYLGDAMKYPDIFEANKPMLSDPDKIYPGQVLRIPGGKAPSAGV